jgi:hypothetical protein
MPVSDPVRFKTRPSWAASAEPDALTLGLNVGCAVTVTGARRRRLPLSAGFTASSATACRVKASAAGRRGLTVDDEVVVYCPECDEREFGVNLFDDGN